MHDTFLPSVNAFVVMDGGETLVVDAGTPDPMNDTRLMRALLGLGVDPESATLFCTHAHIDHTGLARELAEAGARVAIPEGVLGDMRRFAVPAWRDQMVARMRAEGASEAESAELADVIWDHVVNFETENIAFSTIRPGDALRCGRWAFEVVSAPGHTTGQCVLWEPETRTAFLGDAVLFLCSTCIGFWGEGEDPLGEQLGDPARPLRARHRARVHGPRPAGGRRGRALPRQRWPPRAQERPGPGGDRGAPGPRPALSWCLPWAGVRPSITGRRPRP